MDRLSSNEFYVPCSKVLVKVRALTGFLVLYSIHFESCCDMHSFVVINNSLSWAKEVITSTRMRLDCFLATLFLSQSTGALERSVVFLWQ